MDSETCRTCRWWDQQPKDPDWPWRQCSAVDDYLSTPPSYGCGEYQPRDQGKE